MIAHAGVVDETVYLRHAVQRGGGLANDASGRLVQGCNGGSIRVGVRLICAHRHRDLIGTNNIGSNSIDCMESQLTKCGTRASLTIIRQQKQE